VEGPEPPPEVSTYVSGRDPIPYAFNRDDLRVTEIPLEVSAGSIHITPPAE